MAKIDRAQFVEDFLQDFHHLAPSDEELTSDSGFWTRTIRRACRRLDRISPLYREQILALSAHSRVYDAPEDVTGVQGHSWGREQMKVFQPWQPQYPRHIPEVRYQERADGAKLVLSHAPSSQLIAALGNLMPVTVECMWVLGDTAAQTNIDKKHEHPLRLAVAIELLTDLMANRAAEPSKFNLPRNMNPATIQQQYVAELKEWAA